MICHLHNRYTEVVSKTTRNTIGSKPTVIRLQAPWIGSPPMPLPKNLFVFYWWCAFLARLPWNVLQPCLSIVNEILCSTNVRRLQGGYNWEANYTMSNIPMEPGVGV